MRTGIESRLGKGVYHPSLYQPNNTDTIKFKFRGDKMAKVIGKVASEPPRKGQKISGLLFKRSFNYFIVSPEELAQHTNNELKPSVVRQKQLVVYTHGLPLLRHHLLLIHGKKSVTFDPPDAGVGLKYVPGSDAAAAEAAAGAPNTEIVVMEKIKLTHDAKEETLLLEWNADAENDMWADSILATILQIGSSPATLKLAELCCAADVDVAEATNEAIGLQLCDHLKEVFGVCEIGKDGRALEVSVDGNVASVNLRTFEVECQQTYLAKSVRQATKWFVHSLEPPAATAADSSADSSAGIDLGGGNREEAEDAMGVTPVTPQQAGEPEIHEEQVAAAAAAAAAPTAAAAAATEEDEDGGGGGGEGAMDQEADPAEVTAACDASGGGGSGGAAATADTAAAPSE